jgi:hypothetical protein
LIVPLLDRHVGRHRRSSHWLSSYS